MIKKLFLAAIIGLGLCCTTGCYEEHTDYVIEWSITSNGYSGEHFEEYMSEWHEATTAFYEAFDAEFATVGECTPGMHSCIIRDGNLNKVEKMAMAHAEKAAQKVNITTKLSSYPAECHIYTPGEDNNVVWGTVYGE